MTRQQDKQLQQTLAALRDRWGRGIVQRLGDHAGDAPLTIPTGYAKLDHLLGGGAPQGRISLFSGQATSGITTLAWHVLAHVPSGPLIYLDARQTFDPVLAAGYGVPLSRLLLAYPTDLLHGLRLAQDIVLAHGDLIPLLLLDIPQEWLAPPAIAAPLATTLARLIAPLSRGNCVLLILATSADETPPPNNPLAQFAALYLQAKRQRWRYRRRDVAAYDTDIEVIKNKLNPGPARLSLTIIPEREMLPP